MHIREFAEGVKFGCAGNDYVMLLPREETDSCEAVLERISAAGRTPPNAHSTFMQIFIVLAGEAEITVGPETRRISAPALAYIPQNTNHSVLNIGNDELQYVYISVWPDGIPREERDGGWRRVYADMIQEYADRGYPPVASGT
jgi:quercetin dioxygenase-like cupin family protein